MGEMRRFQKTRMAAAVGAALSLTTTTAYAAEGAGRVLSTSGSVYAVTEDGSTRALKQGRRVYSGDTIETREGRIQIRFHDGGLVSLKPDTRFEIEEYDTDEDEDGGNAVMSLLKGAMRTITGAIDGQGDDDYSVETPVATIGIRGTQYALTLCDANRCGDDVDDGLYGQVVDNSVTVRNEAGQRSFASGSWFQVPGRNTAPKRILQPAGVVFRGDAGAEEGDGELDGEGGGDAVVNRVLEGDNGEVTLFELFSESTETGKNFSDSSLLPNAAVAASVIGEDGSSFLFPACVSDSSCKAGLDKDGNLRLLASDTLTGIDASGDVKLAESGEYQALDATWGRWKGEITFPDGDQAGTVTEHMPWAYSTNPTTTAELANAFSGSGSYTYNMVSGPSAVGGDTGTAWQVDNLSVGMTYNGGSATVGFQDVSLSLSNGSTTIGTLYNSNNPTIDPANGDRGFAVPLEGSFSNDSGYLTAVFAGDAANGLLVDFEAVDADNTGEVVTGVKILER